MMQNTDDTDGIAQRINGMALRISKMQADELYFYNMPISEIHGSAEVVVNGRKMLMFASYGYSGLLGHPRINAAAKAAIDRYGTGTHGVRLLAGTLDLHRELEATIAKFKGTDDSITFSSSVSKCAISLWRKRLSSAPASTHPSKMLAWSNLSHSTRSWRPTRHEITARLVT